MPHSIGRFFYRLRMARGWSLEALAEKSGLAKSYLWAIERDKYSPTIDRLDQLCQAFGLRAGDVLVQVGYTNTTPTPTLQEIPLLLTLLPDGTVSIRKDDRS